MSCPDTVLQARKALENGNHVESGCEMGSAVYRLEMGWIWADQVPDSAPEHAAIQAHTMAADLPGGIDVSDDEVESIIDAIDQFIIQLGDHIK